MKKTSNHKNVLFVFALVAVVGLLILALIFQAPEVKAKALVIFEWLESQSKTPNLWTAFFAGVLASWIANLAFEFLNKKIWKEDTETIHKKLAEIEGKYVELIASLQEAIRGPFIESMLSYHPKSSRGIAKILSNETQKAYHKHWDRVVVTKAADRYLINQIDTNPMSDLQGTGSDNALVWSLDYQVSWTWYNDSKVVRHPLIDLVILIMAPEDAVRDFNTDDPDDASRRYAEFFASGLNCVKCVVPNPQNREKRIPEDVIPRLFDITSITFKQGTRSLNVRKEELVDDPDGLPPGVYKRLRIPDKKEVNDFALDIEQTMDVIYEGTMITPATREKDGAVWGYLGYVPSDIVANSFNLSVTHPSHLKLNGKDHSIEVVSDVSGCQYLSDPLRHNPAIHQVEIYVSSKFRPTSDLKFSQISVNEPLTPFHFLIAKWKATPEK